MLMLVYLIEKQLEPNIQSNSLGVVSVSRMLSTHPQRGGQTLAFSVWTQLQKSMQSDQSSSRCRDNATGGRILFKMFYCLSLFNSPLPPSLLKLFLASAQSCIYQSSRATTANWFPNRISLLPAINVHYNQLKSANEPVLASVWESGGEQPDSLQAGMFGSSH